jgi:hypothetical protein|tara:strand:+ start:34 stop:213 length:180 start_codon:yes stop_codon:yes gene_type:complete
MRMMASKNKRPIFENHYEWCKKEGRDTSWYDEYIKGEYDIRVETSKVLQRNAKKQFDKR